jgi:hypothetical protein
MRNAGQTLNLGDQFIIIWYGVKNENIGYMVVRNWPILSTPEERMSDKRLLLWGVDKPQILLADGSYEKATENSVLYFFQGCVLQKFTISMKEMDLVGIRKEQIASYNDLLKYFRRFKI